jgi:hypothetical protein
MDRFNVRPINVVVQPTAPAPMNKAPSAYSAMKHGTTSVPSAISVPSTEHTSSGAKKGRPSKDELRRHKLDLADAGIQVLLVSKPNKAKIREYIQNRILQLDGEKR